MSRRRAFRVKPGQLVPGRLDTGTTVHAVRIVPGMKTPAALCGVSEPVGRWRSDVAGAPPCIRCEQLAAPRRRSSLHGEAARA